MPKRASRVERFTQECVAASPEELDLMLDILKGVRGKRQPKQPKPLSKPKPQRVPTPEPPVAAANG